MTIRTAEADFAFKYIIIDEDAIRPFYEDGTPYKPDPLSRELRKTPSSWWWKKPNLAIHRKRAWWTRQYFSTLNDLAIKKRYRKMKYGERKKFMASVKSKSSRITPTKH